MSRILRGNLILAFLREQERAYPRTPGSSKRTKGTRLTVLENKNGQSCKQNLNLNRLTSFG